MPRSSRGKEFTAYRTFAKENIARFVPITTVRKPLFTQATDDPATKKEFQDMRFGEIHYRLAESICGANKYGRQSFVLAKRQMQEQRVTIYDGIKEYYNRILDWNSYLQYLLWDAGNAEEQLSTPFADKELVEMMEAKLPQPYLDALEEHQHDVWTHTFQETVDTLAVMEEKI